MRLERAGGQDADCPKSGLPPPEQNEYCGGIFMCEGSPEDRAAGEIHGTSEAHFTWPGTREHSWIVHARKVVLTILL